MTKGSINFDAAAGTMTERATETFTGTPAGAGKGTLTGESTWTGPSSSSTRDYVTEITGGTGKLKKVRGHGEESIRIAGDEFTFPGSYAFTLRKK